MGCVLWYLCFCDPELLFSVMGDLLMPCPFFVIARNISLFAERSNKAQINRNFPCPVHSECHLLYNQLVIIELWGKGGVSAKPDLKDIRGGIIIYEQPLISQDNS